MIVLSSGGPVITNDNVSFANILGLNGHRWYEFEKEPMIEETYLPYLAEKLGLEESIVRQFIREFNNWSQNEHA